MFSSLPHSFRDHGLQADVRTLLLLRRSLERGLVRTIGDLYLVLRGIVANKPEDYGPFTEAFYAYFLSIDIEPGERLDQAIQRSRIYQEWLEKQDIPDDEDLMDRIDEFLNEIHLSSYDIKNILDGEAIFREDNSELEDELPADAEEEEADAENRPLDQAADYSNMTLEELLERLRQVSDRQRTRHQGGSHWVGSGGISPYGQGGAGIGGIRTGGIGGGRMARKVLGDRQFYPIDLKMPLQDDNIDVALSFLKGIEEESAETLLDIPETIRKGTKEGGLFLPIERDKFEQRVRVILLVDNGGRSMTPYVRVVLKLFSKMKRHFGHDLKTYYFHNSIYGGAYTDAARFHFRPLDQILAESKDHRVFIIGDADMAPYELSQGSMANWEQIVERFPRAVWLNPQRERYWDYSFTISIIKAIFPMFPLTMGGLERAVLHMNQKG